MARANTGSQPSYAGPEPAGHVTAAQATTASPAGANQATRPGNGRRVQRPWTTTATSAPTRISPSRAGVAQYAASGPATTAVSGATTAPPAASAPTISTRRRRCVRSTATSTTGQTQ